MPWHTRSGEMLSLAMANTNSVQREVDVCWRTNWLILFSKSITQRCHRNGYRSVAPTTSSKRRRMPWLIT